MDEKPPAPVSPLRALRRFTEARIGLGRFGAGQPTAVHLDFAEAHAKARDAVHTGFDLDGVAGALTAAGRQSIRIESLAGDRATYLRRPDLGRRLSAASRDRLAQERAEGGCDLVLIVADGLSATAVNHWAVGTALAVLAAVPQDWRVAPVVLAEQGRVALSDPIGEALGARLALMLVGERPGLSAADSLGAYLTFGPRPGRTDADRNCVSNIRPGGIAPEAAGRKLGRLAGRAASLGFGGTRLKDDETLIEAAQPAPLLTGEGGST
ncbi:ethanolamine ammonia-lyase subunit EutC [Aurantimonas sp. MSK8Z-1]|uniref:ethanolamine ammonia-lyase subunit EutC n=1 Tax=Mangrovibrevibacter kandeliae TaxID=2968473 RepID=UPI002117ECD7|nr:ethanolamine ammonia-lyase subunit EutC [Aurantimonas sp. MSK8Z-1]MCW4116788.1 ethanolamine ammonia-lyase subunit EutC [Aurantimonas sp. MSK8Z-1]